MSLPQIPSTLAEFPVTFSEHGLDILTRRYLRKDEQGAPAEDVRALFWRVAAAVSTPEIGFKDEKTRLEIAERFFRFMMEKKFFPNSPTFTGAGTPLGQLAACFVLAIDDDMGKDSQEGIFSTLRIAALIQQTGGGIGFSFSRLRPRGSLVRSSMGSASGPISFLSVYDCAFGAIAQGGTRRGASMGVLRVDHPDIADFIVCKTNEGTVTNFNISVGITDKFMECVRENAPFELVNPVNKEVIKTVDARDIFDTIANAAHKNGEPGVLFLDTANKYNPVKHLYTLESTNPCGEQYLGPYENCCLGSINLSTHIDLSGGSPKIQWKELENTIRSATRFLDDVIDENKYVPAVPQLEQAAKKVRRIGLGIMGLGDVFYMLGIRYGSDESLAVASLFMEFVRYYAMVESVELAKVRGPFPAIKGSIFDKDDFQFEIPTMHPIIPIEERNKARSYGRPDVNWEQLVNDIKKHGIRNGAQTTIAPTGTIGTVIGCEGYGCEPCFALAYSRRVKDVNGNDFFLPYLSPLFQYAFDKLTGLTDEEKQKIEKHVQRTGSCKGIESLLPSHVANTFVVSSDITAVEHVRVQACLQRFVDNSISKTINFPPTATVDDVKEAYLLAWKLGCKGLTIYVTGSRGNVVLATAETAEKEKEKEKENEKEPEKKVKMEEKPIEINEKDLIIEIEEEKPKPKPKWKDDIDATFLQKRPRPKILSGSTFRTTTPLGVAYLTVNEHEGEPFEVFLTVGKSGSDVSAVAEALGRLLSLALRIPSTLTPLKRLEQIVSQLEGIGGAHQHGFGKARVRSLPDSIAKVLSQYIEAKAAQNSRPSTPTFQLPTKSPKRRTISSLAPSHSSTQRKPLLPTTSSASMISFHGGDMCPECGNCSLLNTEGCKKCASCGYSEC